MQPQVPILAVGGIYEVRTPAFQRSSIEPYILRIKNHEEPSLSVADPNSHSGKSQNRVRFLGNSSQS